VGWEGKVHMGLTIISIKLSGILPHHIISKLLFYDTYVYHITFDQSSFFAGVRYISALNCFTYVMLEITAKIKESSDLSQGILHFCNTETGT